MTLLKFLNKPYPYEDSGKKRFLISLAFGFFISLFLYVFEPFDISEIEHHKKDLFVLGFGIVTFISLLITYFVFPAFFKNFYSSEKWTTGRELVHISFNISLITILNLTYIKIYCPACMPPEFNSVELVIFAFLSVLIVGMFPITFMVLIYQNLLLRKNIKSAKSVNQNISAIRPEKYNITLYSNNKKNMLNVNSDQLLVIEANGNYINIYFEDNDKVKREIIRNTLKETEEIFDKHSNFVRCHKSYIVNLSKLKKVTGNAQGYKLIYSGLNIKIPVSRNLSKQILKKIRN